MSAIFRGLIVVVGLIWVAEALEAAPRSGLPRLEDFGDALFSDAPVLVQMRERGRQHLARGPLALFEDDPIVVAEHPATGAVKPSEDK